MSTFNRKRVRGLISGRQPRRRSETVGPDVQGCPPALRDGGRAGANPGQAIRAA